MKSCRRLIIVIGGASLEGIANVVYLTGEGKTDNFSLNNYITNIKSTYFYIFMISLHQRYSLLNLSILASNLLMPANEDNSDEANKAKSVRELRKKIILFTLRSSFKHVSTVTHHGKVYQVINNTLQIEELNKELHFELEILDSMIETEREKQTSRNKEKFQDNLLILSNIFVIISVLSATWGLLSPFYDGKYPALWSKGFFLLAVIFLVEIGVGIYGVAQVFKKIKASNDNL